ncbi:MAG: VOC family protein [Proteobacteria bacterium]|nr:VOC family protein [Pseudomonadota bacterium]
MKIDSQIIFLATRDLPGTSDFYEKTLGLPLKLDQGKCRIYRVADNGFIGFCEKKEPHPIEGVIITLVTKEVDEYYDLLRKRGVIFEKEPVFNAEYKIYHCFLRDPNGYQVESQRFEDPRWEEANESS